MDKKWTAIRSDLIVPGLTCPICDNLMKEATSNIECSHTFCRKCIYSIIAEQEIEWCPVCETDWGINPVQKMRPDHNLQSLRDKLFHLNEETMKAFEVVPSRQSTESGTEKSPLPLVVSTSKEARGHRASCIEKLIKNEKELLEDSRDGSSSHESANKSTENTEQTREKIRLLSLSSPDATLSPFEDNQYTHKGAKNGNEPHEARLDIRKPLNSSAGRSTSSKSNVKGSDAKIEHVKVNGSGSQVQKAKIKGKKGKEKFKDKKISTCSDSTDIVETNKSRPCRIKELVCGGSSRSPQEVLDATNTKLLKDDLIWFTLIASENQEGAPLPQIPSPYIRIRDGSVTVSFIQKYLKQKLDLESEDEVEVKCMGKSVHPIMEVRDLLKSWMATLFTEQRITTTMGSSAKDFVMVLTYGRKVPNP